MKAIRCRLGASRILLEGLAGKPDFHKVSQLQQNAAKELILQADLSLQDKADLSETLQQVGFAACDYHALVEALTTHDEPKAKKTRSSLQDFVHLTEYFTENE